MVKVWLEITSFYNKVMIQSVRRNQFENTLRTWLQKWTQGANLSPIIIYLSLTYKPNYWKDIIIWKLKAATEEIWFTFPVQKCRQQKMAQNKYGHIVVVKLMCNILCFDCMLLSRYYSELLTYMKSYWK